MFKSFTALGYFDGWTMYRFWKIQIHSQWRCPSLVLSTVIWLHLPNQKITFTMYGQGREIYERKITVSFMCFLYPSLRHLLLVIVRDKIVGLLDLCADFLWMYFGFYIIWTVKFCIIESVNAHYARLMQHRIWKQMPKDVACLGLIYRIIIIILFFSHWHFIPAKIRAKNCYQVRIHVLFQCPFLQVYVNTCYEGNK